jgi:MGT family glycosyltransferase
VRTADQQVVLTSREFDFPARLPARVRYVGPVLDDPTWARPWTPPAGDEPLVLVAMSSTYMEQERTLRSVVEALGTLPVRGLVTTGPALDPSAVPAPDNVTVVASAPHREVLQEAALAVTHGGHGTVMKCLAAGVPMVVVPHGRDQKDNGLRVAARGAGVMVAREAPSARVAEAVQKVLAHEGYREAAEQLGEAVRRGASGDDLVRSLEELARSGRSMPA